ncbi:MAG: hypothetical protein R6V60_00140 [Desulfobacterales bacterium]
MNRRENGDFTFPRCLFEIWYMESLRFPEAHSGGTNENSLYFRTKIITTGESVIVTLASNSGLLIHRRSAKLVGSERGWKWFCDFGEPLSQAMAISEFWRRLKISNEPEINLSAPESRSGNSVWSKSCIDPNKVMESLCSGWLAASSWVVLPPIDGSIIKQTARQLEAVVDWWEPARLIVSDGQMILWARQGEGDETVVEFELERTAIAGVSFTIPRWLVSSSFVAPIEQYQLAFNVEHKRAALMLPNNSALVFHTEINVMDKQLSPHSYPHALTVRQGGDLFSFIHLLGGEGSA